ncbi:DUF397 domain-containing protein [Actinoalloteichus hymeniacidonis]|uniref:DUF397 family protein n=1 Tax=Actinoalloteichus hymeniacidonis TaxID=340345 RepID=A0AAC9HMG1_9PSEU|nr:DUF397 domain-containing protein [Actinoalloteichus hymeniacidonis]AOS61550.1 putative DUF397 family protein [Actinoalloteichus hymeniacidonis]MBB5910442.1 hypothetical protein [Actinoalloteichus hymeniacidonis]
MTTQPHNLPIWRKSSRSENGGNCVEIGHAPGLVGIRDTKNRAGGTLHVDPATFGAFVLSIKANRLG